MKRYTLRHWIFMALCCSLGLAAKKLISPAANVLTGLLHIPGGIGTSFSLLFLVIAAALVRLPGCAALIGAVQSVLALGLGTVGSMGVLAPVGYIVPGLVIDCTLWLSRRWGEDAGVVPASILGSLAACLCANAIVFRLRGVVLLLYAGVSCFSGAVCGLLAAVLVRRLRPIVNADYKQKGIMS